MSKSAKIELKKAIDFKNHFDSCRLCLKSSIDGKEKLHKITKVMENQYFSLTLFDVSQIIILIKI
jgi:hypothetical protein